MAEKRVVVNDLGDAPQLSPQADPRALDIYYRPGAPDIGSPAKTNPMLKLAESLGALEPVSQALFQRGFDGYTKGLEAEGEAEFNKDRLELNREEWNKKVREGLPPGANPWHERGYRRSALKQMSEDFFNDTHNAFYGEEGAEARNSNDPKVMQKFLQDQEKKLREGLGSASPLDIQEVLNPSLSQHNQSLMRTHAAYRVSEREKDFEAQASARITQFATDGLKELGPEMGPNERAFHLKDIATKINGVLYDPDTGYVVNGGQSPTNRPKGVPSKGNEILINSLKAVAIREKNPAVLEILDHITNKDGAPISKTQAGILAIESTEEHITAQKEREVRFNHWVKGLPHEERQREHTEQTWARQDVEWQRKADEFKKQEVANATEKMQEHYTKGLYAALRRSVTDPKGGQERIDAILQDAEQSFPKVAEHLHSLVHTSMKQRVDYEDNPMEVAKIRVEMSRNPLGFKAGRLQQLVESKQLTVRTMMQLADDLERNQQRGDHPYMEQPDFVHMIGKVEQMAITDDSGEGKTVASLERGVNAMGEFRDKAQEWIEKNPNGSVASFRNYMREQIDPIVQRNNPEHKKAVTAEGNKQASRGEAVVKKSQEQFQQKELERKETEKKAAKKKAEEDHRAEFNKSFKPTGKKSAETGREFLQDEKGNVATQKMITINGHPGIANGGIVNVPTIIGGKLYSDEEAIELIAKNGGKDPDTGKPLKRYYSISAAEIAAREQSARLGKEWDKLKAAEKKGK
jgi:hypothetical protein